jgi:dihydrolipoamide dehydrogenase
MTVETTETTETLETLKVELAVLGAGPGGYAAAFYAADLGRSVLLIDQHPVLGGTCLRDGCIPSKALLNATRLIRETEESSARGISFGAPDIDISKLRSWKDGIVDRLSKGIGSLAKSRGVKIMSGRGHFEGPRRLRVRTPDGPRLVDFDDAIIAVGSEPAIPKAWDLKDPRVMTSTEALQIDAIPDRLLVIGGGYIGMELGSVYADLGSKVVVIEALDRILAGADPDLVRPVFHRAKKNFSEIRLQTVVKNLKATESHIEVTTEKDGQSVTEQFDRVLVAVGRRPTSNSLGLENTTVEVDDGGFIKTDAGQRTTNDGIYAIGDVAGGVLLAHKAAKEARVAVETLMGEGSQLDAVIPAVVFTDPEVAWCGLTELEAQEQGIAVEIAKFPWGASGRAVATDRPDGVTKLIIEPETERILGMGITGHGAGELIGEGVVLIEMGATARDLADSVHPHPTLSETLMESAELFYGHATHAATRRKK